MTEEIIIDGVNVAGCCYYESKNDTGKWCDLTCKRDNAPFFRCEKMPNCHYKQLKRLEQERDELKQENLHLREQLEPFNDVYFKDLTKGTIAQLAKTSLRNTADNCKLTHALEEIRDYLYTLTTVDNDFVNTETYLRINDKIEEVLNA